MTKRPILFALIAMLFITTFTACKKYPDGPGISLRSRSERVANNWKVGQAYDNGKDVTGDYNKYDLNLTKSGGASLTAKYSFAGTAFDYTTTGTWAFVNNDEKISFDYSNNSADGVYKILKLKENEMWLHEDGGSLELHLVTQ